MVVKRQGLLGGEKIEPFNWAEMSFIKKAMLMLVLAAAIVIMGWSMVEFQLMPAWRAVGESGFPNSEKLVLSNGVLEPQMTTINPGECIKLDARGQEGFKEWNFDAGRNPSKIAGFCTIPWMNNPGEEMTITAKMNGGISTATIKF